MNFQPRNDYVLIKKYEAPQPTSSLIMPDSYTEKPNEGIVMATGGHDDQPFPEGSHVLYKYGAGMQVIVDGEEYLVMSEEDVLGTFSE